MRIVLGIALLCSLLLSLATASALTDQEEAEKIYSSKELVLTQTTKSTLHIPQGITEANVELAYYPSESYRQTVIDQTFNPKKYSVEDQLVIFSWNTPQPGKYDFEISSKMQTSNSYAPVKSKVKFPIDPELIPKEYDIYLETSENIDINSQIIKQASLLASGSDDLFVVSHDVASWVEGNIEYDLSTLTESVSQPASWTLQNRKGVCDELTSLFIAMMRSLGIPARFVSGMSYTNSPLFDSPWGPHAWAEVYFPGHGWVPFDITYKQFGHVDASHVTLKVSRDADQSYTRYTWTGFGNEVKMDPLDLTIQVNEFVGQLDKNIEFDIEVEHDKIGMHSANLVKINAKNLKDHYTSTAMVLGAPQEIEMIDYLTILLGPNEERVFNIPLQVSGLDAKFKYTIPIQIEEIFGSGAQTTFEVASQYPTYNRDFLQTLDEQPQATQRGSIATDCSTEPYAQVDTEFLLLCQITNDGNIYYEDAQICLDKECVTADLAINQKTSVQKRILSKVAGDHSVQFSVFASGQQIVEQPIIFPIHDIPRINISLEMPENIAYKESANFTATITPDSTGYAQRVAIKVYSGINPLIFTADKIDRTYILEGAIYGKELKEGQNDIIVDITYYDAVGNQYTIQETQTMTLDELTFMQSLLSGSRRLLRGIFS